MTTNQTTVKLSDLHPDKSNVRHIRATVPPPELVASIKALGVIVPLIVRPNGDGYVVTDGGQRFDALRVLAKQGAIPNDFAVPVTIAASMEDNLAREISLATTIRRELHPVDQYRAIIEMYRDRSVPFDVPKIAEHFGLTEKRVKQCLALGGLDETVLDAWVAGKVSEKAAQAFTLADTKTQRAILKDALKDASGPLNAYSIQRALKIDGEVGPLLNVVGLEAYEARGGKITRDLFGDDHAVSDKDLLRTMVREKVDATCEQLKTDGWSFAIADYDSKIEYWKFGQLPTAGKPTPDEKKKLAQLADAIDDEALTDDEREAASDEYDRLQGEISVRSFTPKLKKTAGCVVSLNAQNGLSIRYALTQREEKPEQSATKSKTVKGKDGKPARKDGPNAVSKALADRLLTQQSSATKAALLSIGVKQGDLASLVFGLICKQIDPERMQWGTPAVIRDHMDAIRKALPPKIINAALREKFDAADYFASVPKDLCLAAIKEAVNADEARKLAGKPKADIVKFAVTNVGKTGWLPVAMRSPHYEGPGRKKH